MNSLDIELASVTVGSIAFCLVIVFGIEWRLVFLAFSPIIPIKRYLYRNIEGPGRSVRPNQTPDPRYAR